MKFSQPLLNYYKLIGMHYIRLLLLSSFFLIICNSCKKSYKIEGKLNKNLDFLNGRKVFLYNASYKPDIIIDSSLVKNNFFSFICSDTITQSPFFATIKFRDTFNNCEFFRPIGIENEYFAKTIMSSFFVDGSIYFSYRNDSSKFLSIQYENKVNNEPYFMQKEFSIVNETDSNKRKMKLIEDIKLVNHYKSSIFLLNKLFLIKNKITETEAKTILAKFSASLQESAISKALVKYYSHEKKFSLNYNYALSNPQNHLENLFYPQKETQIIVFWASWCLPCRKEIPSLKYLYQKIDSTKVSLTSISVDVDNNSWINALQKEKMPWRQLRCTTEDMQLEMNAIFDLDYIPKIFIKTKDSLLFMKSTEDILSNKAVYIF